jgi:acyl-CoA synthetase (AMP-forming)/AMP-acid ligase II
LIAAVAASLAAGPQVVCFAAAHPKPGEEIAAAAVLVEGSTLDEHSIRAFAAERLADFKVPRRLVILDEIPKDATGTIQRITHRDGKEAGPDEGLR